MTLLLLLLAEHIFALIESAQGQSFLEDLGLVRPSSN